MSTNSDQLQTPYVRRARGGAWKPDQNEDHRAHRDGLAASGYWQACLVVRGSVRRVLEGENPGTVAAEDHGIRYREMFAPGVAAGLVQPFDLAGYRKAPVYIRRGLFAKYARLYAAINPSVIDLRIQTSETACMTGKGLIRSLRKRAKAGGRTFKVNRKRGKGSHAMVSFGERRSFVPLHGGDLPPGTRRAILRQLGVRPEELESEE